MQLTDEQIASLTPEEKKIYLIGEAKKYKFMFGSLADMPDILEWEELEPGINRDAYMKQFEDLLTKVDSLQQHIPERFLKGNPSLK